MDKKPMSLKKFSQLIFFVSLSLLFILNLHNAFTFPSTRGLDAVAHIKYIEFLQTEKRIPMPYEGWEMYQPPLYYLVASILPNLKLAQVLGIITWLSLISCTYYFFKSKIATLLMASLPVIIYQVPAISNEFLAATLISLSMIYYLKILLPKASLNKQIIFGLILGLALISKATAILLIPAILIEMLYSTKANLKLIFKQLNTSAIVTFMVSGWFYLRNLILFKNPLIASPDFPAWENFGQRHIPRDLYFFTNLKGFLSFDFYRSQDYSFLAGTYFSFFYDGHNVIIPPQMLPTLGLLIFLFSLPIFFLILRGFYLAAKSNLPTSRPETIFFSSYAFLLILGYVLYNFKYPFYSTVKGSFLTSMALPLVYFFMKAIEKWDKKQKLAILIYLCLYAIIITKHFWVEGWWY